MKLTIKQRKAVQFAEKLVRERLLEQRDELEQTRVFLAQTQDLMSQGVILESLRESQAEKQKIAKIHYELIKLIGEESK
tara:strand:- start:407 stop:643 length:237 start_codon:yes stop_codon:yes gene_type:complete